MICNFPSCIQGWLDVRDINNDDMQIDDLKSADMLSVSNWKSQFCILMENDSKLYIFGDEPSLEEFPIPSHMEKCRLDLELNSNQMSDSCSCLDDVSTISSKNHDSDRYNSNSSLTHANSSTSKQYVKSGIFRNGSRLFRRVKSNNKLNSSTPTGKEGNFENNLPTKSVSTLKRSLSLSRLNRKKSEEKSESKSPRSVMKNNPYMTQSTGDLTMEVSSVCMARHNLRKDSIIADVHPSLVGERAHCFSVMSLAVEINSDSDFDCKSKALVVTKRIFASKSLLEKHCWMRRLQQTLKPNSENENRLNNMLKLTIFESKFLPTQKRRYFCEISLDKILYAKTTSKLSNNEGCVFWAEDLVLNNLPNFKTLSINLYKEPDPVKDSKKKKRKHMNQCIGCVTFNIANLSNKNEFQSWYPIKSVDLLPDLNTNPIQLRVKLRYQTLKVLKSGSYDKLAQIATKNYLELILFLEKNLPVKLREEIANCLVNIHENNGTIIEFLTDLISQEVNDLDNSSMTLRANTIVTKIIESHMKLVGAQYLHNMLHTFIRDVMFKNVTIEVDSSKINFGSENPDKIILDNQHRLVEYLKHIWYKIYDSKDKNFPKQLKLIFTGWRKILESSSKGEEEKQKIATHCDVIVSGCIFLRLLCPAILSPHLFGLVSHFSDKTYVQRTLTLIAKSLQSLANFSQFGDKEHFMIFLNKCFEEEIPRMHEFLRSISSVSNDNDNSLDELTLAVTKEVKFYGSTIDLSVELARLHHCLASESMKDHLNKSPKIQNILKLPDIIREINQQLQTYHPQSTPSFFSYKKSAVPIYSSTDQRRSSLGPLVISKIQDLGRLDKDNSPPRLGSPICQSTSVVDPISEYGMHANDIWQLRSDVNCTNNSKTSKSAAVTPIVYSVKQQYTMCPIPKSQMNVTSFHKGHYNTRETDESQITDTSYKKHSDQNNLSSNPSSHHNPLKSAIPKSILSQNKRISTGYFMSTPKIPVSKTQDDEHYAKVHDTTNCDYMKRKSKTISNEDQCMEFGANEFYRENPLYDYLDASLRSTPESDRYPQNTIDRYFSVRSHVSLLEQQLKQNNSDSNKNQNLQDLYQEMESIRMEVQNEQLKDLKQLKQMVNFNKNNSTKKMYSSFTNSPSELSNPSQKDASNLVMTETLDEVINAITIDGAGLEEAQINLRRQHMKKDRCIGKMLQSSITNSSRPRQQSLGTIFNIDDSSIQTVPIDYCESPAPIISSSSTPVKSQSSSNCSSLTPWLI